ncbi:MAG: DUF29 domain-containing protein [Acetobacteraceae bacterium]
MGSLYDSDLVAWSAEQARVIREAGRQRVNAPIDWENVAEEIESLGKSERRTLSSRIRTVIEHLLKLQVSSAIDPVAVWLDTIQRTREEIAEILADSPSLRREVPEMVARQLKVAQRFVLANLAYHGETPLKPLEAITFDEGTILGDWLPDRAPPLA